MVQINRFKFSKVDSQVLGMLEGEISVTNNVAIKNLEKNGSGLKLTFDYKTKYVQKGTEFAFIVFSGEVEFSDTKVDSHLEEWKKAKKLPSEVMSPVLNFILGKSNLESLKLSQVLGLPSPIPLPEVKVE